MIAPSDDVGGSGNVLPESLTLAVTLEPGEREATILALAQLSVQRPGWESMLSELAKKFGDQDLFQKFRTFAGPPPGWPKDSSNRFEVVRRRDKVVITRMAPSGFDILSPVLSIEQALSLAAWLAVMADPELKEFQRILQEIKK